MASLSEIKNAVFGKPLDPFQPGTRKNVLVVAFLAWIGLGADGLSSACYGPEEAFLALGSHHHLALFLAVLTAVTVFVIALSYNQVIELFPSGGGGYKVATKLIGPRAGLVSGSALIVDYVLTIAISVASGMDALFSLLPESVHFVKLAVTLVAVVALIGLNLRGMKESIQVLLPIFLGFFITHAWLILYGIIDHADRVPTVLPDTLAETQSLVQDSGWLFAIALFLRAYSLGGGTYTGLEAVSNNVHMLAEPRVKTGKWTMIYMAASLSFTAGGIIMLYLLWGAQPVEGKTLNAVVFGSIIENFDWSPWASHAMILLVLGFEAGLLVVAANTGFFGGPAVLASMAADSWMPHQFRHLSNRLVTQNGVVLMGICALAILLWTGGSVSVLVVLYSINVFLTFSLSLFGLCRYWLGRRRDRRWLRRFALSAVGFAMTSGILLVTVVEKFIEGGWLTLVVTGVVIVVAVAIRRHYDDTTQQLKKADALYADEPYGSVADTPEPDRSAATAIFIIGGSRGGGMYALKWVQTHFPGHFRNFVFISARAVDANSYGGEQELKLLRQEATVNLRYYVNYCRSHGLAADSRISFGTDAAEEVVRLADGVRNDYPNCMFFTSKLVFPRETWFVRALHNQTAMAMQSRLHLKGMEMMILPMRVA